ncbi:ABC transporter substrate-binding protein [Desulforhopalus singaporensis]|uniref:Putative ABC transport system substrate-binding protein n=1 Tax=Desulforhopalus singaporensis TaxID=91360 RepID=A0A1H0QFA5_9BACT|nr:ABC transporter substrate-binding protein [Desulforhopalus singaporensis]SDP15368.1 putative ABC transport system substrate-binding protein [Desulforhopalus singaporensis]
MNNGRVAICLVALLYLFLCGVTAAVGADREKIVAMITWRGDTPAELGFMDGLTGYGYNVHFVKYPADRSIEKLAAAVAALENNPVDLIYVFGTTATKHVLRHITTIPVVFNIVTRPVESGIIDSWSSSGNNATGVSSMVPVIHQLETLKKVIDFKTMGIIYNPREQNSVIQRDIVKDLEKRLNFKLYDFEVEPGEDIDKSLAGLTGALDAVFLPSDSMVKTYGKKITGLLNTLHIPTLAAMEDMVIQDGALMGLVPEYYQLGRLAAVKADAIFSSNAPDTIPTSTLDYFKITVNMNTARMIGINIPTSILVMADKIMR